MVYTKTRTCPHCKEWVVVERFEDQFDWDGDENSAPVEAISKIRRQKTSQDFMSGAEFHLRRVFRIDQERKTTELQFQPFRNPL